MTDLDLCALAAESYTAPPHWQSGDVQFTLRWAAPKEPVVTFKGTSPDSLADWLRDLDAIPEHDPDLGWCHRGFLNGARAALPAVLQVVQGCPATLVGHSLGGALAALTAALMTTSFRPVSQVVTFGCPKVGLWGVRSALKETPCRRYVHGDDVVPNLPPGLEHHTPEPVSLPGIKAPLGNHFIASYLKALTDA